MYLIIFFLEAKNLFHKINLKKITFLIMNIFIYLIFIKKEKKANKIIYNLIFNNKTIDYILKMRKVVYTVNLGKYDKLKDFNKQKGWDYFAFIDSNFTQIKETNWTLIYVEEDLKILNLSKIKYTRYLKLHPHLFFKNYSLSIYIDATYSIKGDLNEFCLRLLSPKKIIYSLEHYNRNSVFSEINVVTLAKKDKNSTTSLVRIKYQKEKFPDNNGLVDNSLIIRKHNEKKNIFLMEEWWKEIKNYSHRDQLSFNYAMWKTRIKNKYI